ncbi:hypothetical protein AwErysi_07230 [Erysipelotrichaceae bacterium]|nr:hypothetical protein AwErysi_07230 [Erysipelotrichaceae bacterium]
MNLLIQNITFYKKDKYLTAKELEILQTAGVLFYQDGNFKKNQKTLVLKLIPPYGSREIPFTAI